MCFIVFIDLLQINMVLLRFFNCQKQLHLRNIKFALRHTETYCWGLWKEVESINSLWLPEHQTEYVIQFEVKPLPLYISHGNENEIFVFSKIENCVNLQIFDICKYNEAVNSNFVYRIMYFWYQHYLNISKVFFNSEMDEKFTMIFLFFLRCNVRWNREIGFTFYLLSIFYVGIFNVWRHFFLEKSKILFSFC